MKISIVSSVVFTKDPSTNLSDALQKNIILIFLQTKVNVPFELNESFNLELDWYVGKHLINIDETYRS